MRVSKTVSITLPPDMLARVLAMAKAEDRTMSELVREALRRYERVQARDDVPDMVMDGVRRVRRQLWPRYKKKQSKPRA
jgi:predicted transcriptional regulator